MQGCLDRHILGEVGLMLHCHLQKTSQHTLKPPSAQEPYN